MGRFLFLYFRKLLKFNYMKRNRFFNIVTGSFLGLTTSLFGYSADSWQFWLILVGGIIILDIVYNLIQKD